MVRETQRIRIRFKKTGNLCFIGHMDLLRVCERLFRRARLPLAMSEGYHPKVRMSFPSALSLGIEGTDEVLELELTAATDTESLLELLNSRSIDGLEFSSAEILAPGTKKAMLFSSAFEMTVPSGSRTKTDELAENLMRESSFPVEKTNGKTVDVRKALRNFSYEKDSGKLEFELLATQGSDAGCREVLSALQLEKEYLSEIFPTRSKVNLVGV